MGVQTVMLMAQFFGIKAIVRIDENGNEVVGMETGELIVAIILVQLIAIPEPSCSAGWPRNWATCKA